jgi:hypothetical protein
LFVFSIFLAFCFLLFLTFFNCQALFL